MSRGPLTFKQRDVTRALKAARAAGIELQRVEIEKSGKIILIPESAGPRVDEPRTENEWDLVS